MGYVLNPATLLCIPCNEFCLFCEDTVDNCPACKTGYFKDTISTDCFETCQNLKTYGNKNLEVCFEDPAPKVDFPKDGEQFQHGDFITMRGSYDISSGDLKLEEVTLGWKVVREVKD